MLLTDPSRDLADIAWDFAGDLSSDRLQLNLFDARKHHWYPATYIPEVPFTLIELLSGHGDRVFDPFAGLGTTLWQARLSGRIPYGMESCTVAANLSRWFWTLLQPNVDARTLHSEVREIVHHYSSGASANHSGDDRYELLRPWYSPGTLDQICYLMTVLDQSLSGPTRAVLNIVTSALLKPMCEQRNGWGCVADNMIPRSVAHAPTRPFLERLSRRSASLCRDLKHVRSSLERSPLPMVSSAADHVLHGSVLDSAATLPQGLDLVVTSPPYPGMTDYSTSQRLSYYWLGIEPMHDVRLEIGARRKRFASGWLDRYVTEMYAATTRIGETLKPGGYLCMVVPSFSSTPEGPDPRLLAVDRVLDHLAGSGFRPVWSGHRLLPTDRRHLNQRWTRLEKERIAVFQRFDA